MTSYALEHITREIDALEEDLAGVEFDLEEAQEKVYEATELRDGILRKLDSLRFAKSKIS